MNNDTSPDQSLPLARFAARRVLSSAQTVLMKFIFPTIWISVFGLNTLAVLFGALRGRGGVLPPESIKWLLLVVWVAGTVFILWGCGRLKRVKVDNAALYVSNYFEEVRIPFDAIRSVTENCWINIHPVTIHLRHTTPFGDRIVFMPTVRLFGWNSHPVVSELRALARL